MKKILLIIMLFIWFFSFVSAEENTKDQTKDSNFIEIKVSTKIPWVSCEPIENKSYYKCKVEKWTHWVIKMIWAVIKWFTFLTSIVAVLVIVIAWIMYSMWWADEELKNQAKTWITRIIFWLIILFSSGYILQLIAPWVYK